MFRDRSKAVKEALKKISTDTVKVNVLHDAVGGITETDIKFGLGFQCDHHWF